MVEMLAWCGAALSCLLSVPQAIRVLRAERLDGISASTYVIVLGNAAVWAAWSLLTGEYAAGIPGLINGPAAILILHRLMIARHKRRVRGSDGSPLVRGPGNPLWNMSPRAAESLREDLDSRGPVRVSEVEAEQKELLKVVRRLADEGQIVLGGGGDDDFL